MRQPLIAAVTAAAALALASCDPRPLEVTDNSALERITLEVDNDTPKWEFGETRIFSIIPTPATATIDSYDIRVSNPEIVEIAQGVLPNQFKLTAIGEGKLIVTAVAIGHGTEFGNANAKIEKTATSDFNLVDNRVKPTRPVVTLQMAPTTDINAKKILAEDAPSVIADKQVLVLSVSSDAERATYSIKSSDTKVLTVERTGAQSWMLKTVAPGRAFLNLTVTDGQENPFEYSYVVYSYGHVTMTAEYDPLMAEAGISISEHDYPDLTGQVYMAGTIFGWPWNDVNNIASRDIPLFNGTLDFSEEFEHPSLVETYDLQNEIYNMTVGEGLDKAWFSIHEVKLNYIVTLSNSYIIIDNLIDDDDREETLWWNFKIMGALQQEGITPVEMSL
jgi:hypothetical protein